ncbi:MAG: 2'-5' RNA ligase family protein [Actinomycetota bacterium]|nr:2'-5' RNA ligase family protein [Actinomycetota bacterium]
MPKGRYGIVIGFPTGLAAQIDGLRRALGSPQLNRIEPHVTIYPPTSLPDGEFRSRLLGLRRLAAETEPFTLRIAGAGAFERELGVLYLQVERSEGLVELEEGVRGVMDAPARKREFIPHATLFDNAPLEVVAQGVGLFASFSAEVEVDGFKILRMDTRSTWHRFAEALFEPARGRALAGSPATFWRTGEAGEWLFLYGADGPSSEFSYPSASVAYGITREGAVSVAGFRGEEMACAAVASISGASAYLEWAWVAETERGTGVAPILLEELAYAAAEEGMRALVAARGSAEGWAWKRIQAALEARGARPFELWPGLQEPILAYRLSLLRL